MAAQYIVADDNLLQEDEKIDKLNMKEAIMMCRKHKIEFSQIKQLHKLRQEIKLHRLSKGSSREQFEDFFQEHTNDEQPRKDAMCDVFEQTIEYTRVIQSAEETAVEELVKAFPNIIAQLESECMKVKHQVAPILVLGETGSGKSTFINLLLGAEILPSSLLSNTHVICKIRYSDNQTYKAICYPVDDREPDIEITDNESRFKAKIAEMVQAIKDGTPVYKRAEIYLPYNILKGGLTIVDSPGVGETAEMENLVLDYVVNAAAFIYVIDITNAGGVQERVERLLQNVCRRALTDETLMRPEIAIFICNKWDEVELDDREDVLQDTRKKIKKLWPGCEDDQIIPFSTVEAQYIQSQKGVAPKFSLLLGKLKRLMPEAQDMVILKGCSVLKTYLDRSRTIFETRLKYIKLDGDKKLEMRTKTKGRLREIQNKVEAFFQDQRALLSDDVNKTTNNLREYLSKEKTKASVCSFSESELPTEPEWEKAAIQVRLKVYERIRSHIRIWESEHLDKTITVRLQDAILKEFPSLESELTNVENELAGRPEVDAKKALTITEEDTSVIPNFMQNIAGMPAAKKILLAPLLPLLLIGMVGRLPYVGFKQLERLISVNIMTKEFLAAKGSTEKMVAVCKKYAEKVFNSITDRISLKEVIKEDMQMLFDLLDGQENKMKRQIRLDLDLLQKLKAEMRQDADIEKVYEPLNAKFKILSFQLNHFMVMHFPTSIPNLTVAQAKNIEIGDTVICSGIMAEIKTARRYSLPFANRSTDVCIRRQKHKVEFADVDRYKQILKAYGDTGKVNFQKCLCFWTSGGSEDRLCQVFEPLQCSLRMYLDLKTGDPDFMNNRYNSYLKMMRSIVVGLEYMHDESRKWVHFDLSLDTIGVDMTGEVKLTNICLERPVSIPLPKKGKVKIVDYVHLSPRLLKIEMLGGSVNFIKSVKMNNSRIGRDGSGHDCDGVCYTSRDDMYSVGMVMWEMWTGEKFEAKKGIIAIDESVSTDDECSSELEETVGETNRLEAIRGVMQSKGIRGSLIEVLENLKPCKKLITHEDSEGCVSRAWWDTMCTCINLEKNMTASQWLKSLSDCHAFPLVSIVHGKQGHE
ncbi:uncharacterized protein LOC128213935 [Mya arenaria]|uniref:uncharacterized protein LOC128213935 n=1 Tax=Mya arenaria TaxID=6604 RepID=UPI0022E687F0|nr:uncharacterized protein LOC128213935 [Mya arenaria]